MPYAHKREGRPARAVRVAERLRTGTVWVNDYHLLNPWYPFGGYKQSGVGRELGEQGYLEYTQTKHVHVDITQQRARHRWFDVTIPRRRPPRHRLRAAQPQAPSALGLDGPTEPVALEGQFLADRLACVVEGDHPLDPRAGANGRRHIGDPGQALVATEGWHGRRGLPSSSTRTAATSFLARPESITPDPGDHQKQSITV